MSKITRILIIFIPLWICSTLSYSTAVVGIAKSSTQFDTLANWTINQSFISIDTTYILKSPIEVDGKLYNYKRIYKLEKGYSEWGGVNTGQIIEYGNVDSKYRPNGIWTYKVSDDWTPIHGSVKNGYKVGWWGYNCAYVCKIKYSWNWIFTTTKVTKRRILHD